MCAARSRPASGLFLKETLVSGRPARIECIDIAGQTFTVSRGLVRVIHLEDDWFQEVADPERVIEALRQSRGLSADIFTFCQRLPHVEPRYAFQHEWESVGALPLQSYDYWWSKQIEGATRNQIRKSAKVGVEVRLSEYDDAFVRGMTAIFNETPVRQGRRFWHYGKDVETVRQQFSRNLFREELIGAYYRDTLIGFAMVGRSTHFADLGQIISMIEHRDKSVTSALIAKAVERCCAQNVGHLVYGYWDEGSLGQFKRRLGFQQAKLPRYFVPLTAKGRLAIQTGAHRGLKSFIPPAALDSAKNARSSWYKWQERRRTTANS